MTNTEAIYLSPLIEALKKASKAASFEEQLAELEIALVEAELHPKPATYCQLLWGIDLVKNIDITKRRWQPLDSSLLPFFAENQG
jgi:hypothetical protein